MTCMVQCHYYCGNMRIRNTLRATLHVASRNCAQVSRASGSPSKSRDGDLVLPFLVCFTTAHRGLDGHLVMLSKSIK